MRTLQHAAFLAATVASATAAAAAASVDDCPGYKASNVVETADGLTADLKLAGDACNVYGDDIGDLKLLVEYQTEDRLHVMVTDADEEVYQVPASFFDRPADSSHPAKDSQLEFSLKKEPFSFQVSRRDSGEVIFDTSSEQLIFESQYLRLRTDIPKNANIYGFGEHSDSFRLETNNYTRTLWNREAPFIPRKENLYGSHPMYLEHRKDGSHGVFFLNSNGMDVKFNETEDGDSYLEYNTLGGVVDFYFLAGPTPTDVSKQAAGIFGQAAMMPYWSLGFHQCKYGYWDVNMLAEVVGNFSTNDIPLEVLWADIDYMDHRKDFTTDNQRFPIPKMRELVQTLHDRDQSFIMMLDPGISRNATYGPYARGIKEDVFLQAKDGSPYRGVQWAGEVVWPDYNSEQGKQWWMNEMKMFFDKDEGIDVDGLWNDMNEVSNFCPNITCDPRKQAEEGNSPPEPTNTPRNDTGRPIPGFPPDFQPPSGKHGKFRKRADGGKKGLPDRDLLEPAYPFHNANEHISDSTLYTNISNHDGTYQYDTHNMYGLAMVKATRAGLLERRPDKRPFVLTRSTFASSGVYAAHWFGDNNSTWSDYRVTIPQMLGFTSVHQMPMVGSDVCGFNGVAEEHMCARWTALGAFMPFYRNHADASAPPQEFYLWKSVAETARKSLAARYKLLDYIYTALYRASSTGVPSVNPMFFLYPEDEDTFGIDTQFFLGDSILVSPVTEDESQSVEYYMPDDIFYDFWAMKPVRGKGEKVKVDDVAWSDIPVHIRGGSIIPMRSESANTTTALRKKSFTLVVAPGLDGKASGSLFLDDGESVDVGGDENSSDVTFSWDGSELTTDGSFGYESGDVVEKVVVLGDKKKEIKGNWSLDGKFSVSGK